MVFIIAFQWLFIYDSNLLQAFSIDLRSEQFRNEVVMKNFILSAKMICVQKVIDENRYIK
jgi:hypothetical protein